jgi:hypothetical protein
MSLGSLGLSPMVLALIAAGVLLVFLILLPRFGGWGLKLFKVTLSLAIIGLGVFAYRASNDAPDALRVSTVALEKLLLSAAQGDVATCWTSATPRLQEQLVRRAKALASCDPLRDKAPELLTANLAEVSARTGPPTRASECAQFKTLHGDVRMCPAEGQWHLDALPLSRHDLALADCLPPPPPPQVDVPPLPVADDDGEQTAEDAGTSEDDALIQAAFPAAKDRQLAEQLFLVAKDLQRTGNGVAFLGVITAPDAVPDSETADEGAVHSDYCEHEPFSAELIALRKSPAGWHAVGRLPLENPPHAAQCPTIALTVDSPHLSDDTIGVLATSSVDVEGGDAPDSPALFAGLHDDSFVSLLSYSVSSKETVQLGTGDLNNGMPDLVLTSTDNFDQSTTTELYRWDAQRYELLSTPLPQNGVEDAQEAMP